MKDTISKYDPTILYHHGIKGQKWGVRRFQNKDGSLTAAGRQHVGARSAKGNAHRAMASVYALNERTYNRLGNKQMASMNKAAKNRSLKKAQQADEAKAQKKAEKQEGKKGLSDKQKKALKVGAAVAGTALAAYGTYKVANAIRDKRRVRAGEEAASRIIGYAKFNDNSILNVRADGKFTEPIAHYMSNTGASRVYKRGLSDGTSVLDRTSKKVNPIVERITRPSAKDISEANARYDKYAKEVRKSMHSTAGTNRAIQIYGKAKHDVDLLSDTAITDFYDARDLTPRTTRKRKRG